MQTSDAKVHSKTAEESENSAPKVKHSSIPDDFVTSTEDITERDEVKITTTPSTTTTPSATTPKATENDDYASLQNNFAQMLSDFLNSNDKSARTVNNIERHNSTENSISFILGLDNNNRNFNNENQENGISSNQIATNSPTENAATNGEEAATSFGYGGSNTEFSSEHPTTTTEEPFETSVPNKLLGTSTTTEISLETEICYRGKCVKTKKSKASDLLPVE